MSAFVIPSIFTAIDKLTAPLRSMQAAVSAFGRNAESQGARSERAFRRIGNSADKAYNALNPFSKLNSAAGFLGISVGVAGATSLIKKFINEASKIEDATARFDPLVGGIKNAEDLVKKLNIAGAQTPYEFADIADIVANFLPAMKGNGDEALRIFNMIGDAAGGNVDRLQRIALGYNKTLLKQKVTLEGLNIIAEAGVPIFGEMAKVMYKDENATDKLFKAISAGQVPMSVLEKSFANMTSQGGLYYQSMIKASKTLTGVMSTLTDNVNIAFASIGQSLLPVIKEYALRVSEAMGNVVIWAQNNQGLIKAKVAEWVEKISNVLKFLYNNFDTIVTIAKVYLGTLIALKVASMAFAIATGVMQAATIAYNVVLGISTALQGKSAFFVMGNTVAYGAYRAVVIASTAAQWLLNAALAANPIGATILALVALIALVATAVKYYDTWGATLLFFLGPVGLVISAFKSIYDNWEMIKKGFTTGGIIGGLKALGAVLLDVVLLPMKQILTLMSNLPGAVGRAAGSAADSIEDLRNKLGTGIAAKNWRDDAVAVNPNILSSFGTTPAINTKAQDAKTMYQNITQTNKQSAEITIKDESGKANVSKNTGGIPIKLTPTLGMR